KDSVFVEKEMAMSVIYRLETKAANTPSSLDWVQVKTEIEKAVPGFDYSLLLLSHQVSFYQSKKNWDQYGNYAIKYLEAPLLKKDLNKINEIVWNIFLHCSDAELLKKFIPWGRKAVELSNDNAAILDTYAQLLYKADKLYHIKTGEDYMEMESRVAGLLHQEEIFSKMQRGLPTWEK
ncbi:MAG TPA: hypothetical protein VF421_04205, partial [Niabella sp.]